MAESVPVLTHAEAVKVAESVDRAWVGLTGSKTAAPPLDRLAEMVHRIMRSAAVVVAMRGAEVEGATK